jgi:chromosome segregation ATPase
MANKNENSKTLVNPQQVTPKTRFEIIPTLTDRATGSQRETEEPTFDVESDDGDLETKSKSELRRMLKVRSRHIGDLRFQLEQATSRRRGLEKEIEVREEITADINDDIRGAQAQLKDAASELDTLNADYAALQKAFAETDVLAKDFAADAIVARSALEGKDQTIADLRQQLETAKIDLNDLRTYVDGRKQHWEEHEAELRELQQLVSSSHSVSNHLERDLAKRGEKIEELIASLDDAEQSLAERDAHVERLTEENRSLRESLHDDAQARIREYRDRIASQSGELAAQSSEVDRVRRDLNNLEADANELRNQLQDQMEASTEASAIHEKLETSLDVAEEMINDLTDQLAEAGIRIQEQDQAAAERNEAFERELRQVRFELGRAQDTISEHETINEQLASDLVDNHGFRQALESHLGELEKETDARIQALTTDLRKAQNRNTELERKLQTKDKAISDLMDELTRKSSAVELNGELENALQRIDGYRQEQMRNRRRGEANHRVAKMLIGQADGKELRFPLFKERLTIGRTPHNDIQLNLRFVSRRHAVIATDDNGTRIIDWGSRNGLYVNRKRVTERFLTSGDVVRIGLTDLRYEERPKR